MSIDSLAAEIKKAADSRSKEECRRVMGKYPVFFTFIQAYLALRGIFRLMIWVLVFGCAVLTLKLIWLFVQSVWNLI